MTVLQGQAFRLRAWRVGDEDSLVSYANNRNISRWLYDRFPFPYTRKDAEEWIGRAKDQTPLQFFAIEVDGCAAGGIGLDIGSDVRRRTAAIGYWLAEPFWGRGIVTEAVRLVTDYGFRTFDLVRIGAGIFEGNPASMRVLEKAGYQLEGRRRKAVCKDGQVLDEVYYVTFRG